MEKREKIEKLAQDKDEAMLLARVYDRITAAEQRNIPAATAFLSPRKQVLTGPLRRRPRGVFRARSPDPP